jgi:type IV secretion system protein VirB3
MPGTVGTNPLFLGLTRPAMLMGVSYKFAALNGLGSLLTFVVTGKFFYLLIMLPVTHMIAWLICLKEPRAIELMMAKFSKCNVCKNRSYYSGTNSYDVY